MRALAAAVALVLIVPAGLRAQVGATTDIITGVVTGPDSAPVSGAQVQVISLESEVARTRTTDARGRFTIVFPDGGGQYRLVVRYIGMAPATLAIARQADEDRLVANVQLQPAAVTLEEIGRASCREGVEILRVEVAVKQKDNTYDNIKVIRNCKTQL